jgi:hypothetical protein
MLAGACDTREYKLAGPSIYCYCDEHDAGYTRSLPLLKGVFCWRSVELYPR